MKMLTRTLAGNALNFAVEVIERHGHNPSGPPDYAANWLLGMPILRDHRISTTFSNGRWQAYTELQQDPPTTGIDQLEAGLRCYVGNFIGDVVSIPDAYCTPENGIPS